MQLSSPHHHYHRRLMMRSHPHPTRRRHNRRKSHLATLFTYVLIILISFWVFTLFAYEKHIHDEFMVKETKSLFANRDSITKLYNSHQGHVQSHLDDDQGYKDDDDGANEKHTNKNNDDNEEDIDDFVALEDPKTYLTMYGRHRFHDSFHNLPQWLQTYFTWHKEQTANANADTKYAVLTCLPEDDCGGLSDRLRPLPFLLMIAMRTNRVLCFYWRKSFGLEEFLQPVKVVGIEWRCPSDIDDYYDLSKMAKRQPKARLFKLNYCRNGWRQGAAPCTEEDIKRINEEEKFTNQRFLSLAMYSREPGKINIANLLVHRHSYGGTSSDETNNITITTSREYLMPDLVNWEYPDMIADIFRVMFEPVPILARRVNMTMTKLGLVENEFVSTHVRARYPTGTLFKLHGNLDYDKHGGLNFGDPGVKKYLLELMQNAIECGHILAPDLKIFFASDHNELTNYAISNDLKVFDANHNSTIVRALGVNRQKEPLHMEFNQSSSVLDFFPVFEDLLIMGGSRCVSHGVGSYGSLAAGLGGNLCRAIHRGHAGPIMKCPNEKDAPQAAVINASEMMFGEQPGGRGKLVYDESKYHVVTINK